MDCVVGRRSLGTLGDNHRRVSNRGFLQAPDGGSTRQGTPSGDAVRRSPSRQHPPPRHAPRQGRRPSPVYKDDPLACRWAAWMSDIRGVSTWELSRRLRASVARDERTVRKTAEARLRAGRIMLSRQGILPWVLWPAGVLPDGWWAENRFQDGLRAWYEVYVVAMKPAVEQAKRQLRTGAVNGPGRDRTCDLGIKSPLLYQLSYRPAPGE